MRPLKRNRTKEAPAELGGAPWVGLTSWPAPDKPTLDGRFAARELVNRHPAVFLLSQAQRDELAVVLGAHASFERVSDQYQGTGYRATVYADGWKLLKEYGHG